MQIFLPIAERMQFQFPSTIHQSHLTKINIPLSLYIKEVIIVIAELT
jgi:hypothetical protein